METKYYENGDITTIIYYRFVGYGIHAQAIYRRIITTFSIFVNLKTTKGIQTRSLHW